MAKELAIAVVSGGLDSTVLVYDLIDNGYDVHMVSFNYGQRHKTELTYAARTARKLGLRHDIVDLQAINPLIQGSALTDTSVDVPEGHYAEETMKLTVVPNRNSIMLNIAAGAAIAESAICIATAVHNGDAAIYPDCRPTFINSLVETLKKANEGFIEENFFIYTPFLYKSKADIASRGAELGVPFEDSWTCYKGGEVHCGRCSTCVERLEAMDLAGVEDRTQYLDTTYWRQAISEYETSLNR
jgi:7-cyano-7-deazaguanine synthase